MMKYFSFLVAVVAVLCVVRIAGLPFSGFFSGKAEEAQAGEAPAEEVQQPMEKSVSGGDQGELEAPMKVASPVPYSEPVNSPVDSAPSPMVPDAQAGAVDIQKAQAGLQGGQLQSMEPLLKAPQSAENKSVSEKPAVGAEEPVQMPVEDKGEPDNKPAEEEKQPEQLVSVQSIEELASEESSSKKSAPSPAETPARQSESVESTPSTPAAIVEQVESPIRSRIQKALAAEESSKDKDSSAGVTDSKALEENVPVNSNVEEPSQTSPVS